MNVFVDTSALYALLDGRDAHHRNARNIRKRLGEEGVSLCTHDWVCAETLFILRKRLGRPFAVGAIPVVFRNPSVRIHAMDPDLREAALKEYEARSVSLVDAASFALMRREGLERAFTFDQDFAAAGFKIEYP